MIPRIICEHIQNPYSGHLVDLHGDKKSNRVCCPACFKKGFLVKILVTWENNGKLIGEVKK